MHAQIDSFQTCLDLRPATSPGLRRCVFLVRVVQKSTFGLQNGGSAQQNRSFRAGETLTFTKRPVQLTVWSPFRGVGSGSKTAIPHGTVALVDPPPAPSQVDFTAQSRGQVQPSGQGDPTVSSTDRFCANIRFASTKRPFL